MTEQELIIQELKDRNINTQSNQNEDDEKELILEQLRERNLFKKTDDGSLLPTPQAQRLDNPYGSIIDDIEIPEMNTRSQAVSDYLKSPEFARLALEVTGGVALIATFVFVVVYYVPTPTDRSTVIFESGKINLFEGKIFI